MRKPNDQGFYALEGIIREVEDIDRRTGGFSFRGEEVIKLVHNAQDNFYGCHTEVEVTMQEETVSEQTLIDRVVSIPPIPREGVRMPEPKKPEDIHLSNPSNPDSKVQKEYSENWGKDFRINPDLDKIENTLLVPGDFCKCSILDDRIVRVQKVVENGVVVEWNDKGLPMVQRVHFEHLEKVH